MSDKSCCGGPSINRRDVFTGLGVGLASLSVIRNMPVMAGPFSKDVIEPIPLDKKLDMEWVKSLYQRGMPTTYQGWDELKYIGMPIGGIGTGSVYIGGDGKLWCWDIFNEHHEGIVPNTDKNADIVNPHNERVRERDGSNYIFPPAQESPWNFEQGFAVVLKTDKGLERRTLDRHGFKNITFKGQAPIADVNYSDPSTDIEVQLEAMTPYIPLDTDRSSYPATVMKYRLKNTGRTPITVSVEGWTENPSLKKQGHRNDATLLNETFEHENGVGFFGASVKRENSPPKGYPPMESLPDYGSIALICCDPDAKASASSFLNDPENRTIETSIISDIRSSSIGGVSREVELGAGESHEFTFIIAWYYPNVNLLAMTWSDEGSGAYAEAKTKRWYASKFDDAKAVAIDVAENLEELTNHTRLWRDTWYDSTLPHWLLERSIIPTNALQTNTSYRFVDGRFWAWEGVGCCPGTCTHVWHYAQAVGRLFPDIERDLRERTDYGLGFHENGAINFRGDVNGEDATDGQAGVILRTYREHQMTSDDAFLKRIYPKMKKALEFLIEQDAQGNEPTGITKGEQHNTLDAEWYGKIPVLASLYLASLRAGEEMANVIGDAEFAAYCHDIHAKGKVNIGELFDTSHGFYIQEEDLNYPDAIGVGMGCYIDQTMGQWWAHQLGLGRIYDGPSIRKALTSLWDYNFCPDLGVLRSSIKDPKLRGRPYAMAGDAGLVMCTWPKGGRDSDWEKHWQYGYFNECMTGFEYEAAGHMIWESDHQPDLLEKGLAISRAIHDRYHGGLRNPYNEIECSDHYARAMASYGVFLAASGFEYDGPKAHLGFKPRMIENGEFKSAFSSAEGWGSFEQNETNSGKEVKVSLGFGKLNLKSMSLRLDRKINQVTIETSHGRASVSQVNKDVMLIFDQSIVLNAGENLQFLIL